MPSWVSRPHTSCRVCQAPLGKPYLDLGEQPLANALLPGAYEVLSTPPEQRFPLQVILCEQCGLSQLSVVVNPEILYAGYRFRSGQSEAWVKHCEELAKRCTKEMMGEFPPKRVLDIACNDGTQLKAFTRRGWIGTGFDPGYVEESSDVLVYKSFFNQRAADTLIAATKAGVHDEEWSPFDLVIAQNVLGHVDDPISFLKAIKTVLAPEGRVVVEVPNAAEMIDALAFDTIYHEHLSYWCLGPLLRVTRAAGLFICGVDPLAIHGGSRRYWLRHRQDVERVDSNFSGLLDYEVATFAQRVEENLNETDWLLASRPREFGGRVFGWGASAKAAVYLNALRAFRIAHQIDVGSNRPFSGILPEAVIDDCVEKQSMLMPGVHIPVIACPESLADVDVLWCLSWNNFDGIAAKARARGFRGKFLITHPNPRLIDA